MLAVNHQQCLRWSLSAAQLGIWFAQKLDPQNPIYNIGQYTEIHGALNPSIFEAALRQVISETDALRLRFYEHPQGPCQTIAESSGCRSTWSMPLIDLSREPNPQASAEAWMRADLNRPVNFNDEYLFKFALLVVGPNRFFWYQRYHHLINDGYGVAIIVQRVAEIYTATMNGRIPSDNPFGSFLSFLEDDDAYRASDRYCRDRDYWIERFADRPEPVSLAGRNAATPYDAVRYSIRLESDATEKVRAVAKAAGASWPQVITAAMAAYLHRITAAEDLIVGLTVTTRVGAATKNVPCTLAGVMPLGLIARPKMRLAELIHQVGVETRQGLRHQRYRSEDLRRDLGLLARDQKLFGPMVNIMSFDYDQHFGGHPSATHGLANGPVDDLSLIVYERADFGGLRMDFIGNPMLYSEDVLGEHLRRLSQLLGAMVDPDQLIGSLEIISEEEREQILIEWNNTACPVHCLTLPDLFENQAALTPSATALVFRHSRLTYNDLNSRANHLALTLISRGIGPENIVALAARRSIEMVVGLLGILKSGAAYLPLDPDNPLERLSFMLDDADPSLVLTTADLLAELPSGIDHILLDEMEDSSELSDRIRVQRLRPLQKSHAAYVIYTSGSTGKPKGVINTHEAIVNRLMWMQSKYQLKADDCVLQKTPFGFDISVWEFFSAWLGGGVLVMAEPGGHKDPAYLAEVIKAEKVTTIHFVPSMLKAFLEHTSAADCGCLRRVICSGEALTAQLEKEFYSAYEIGLHNFYGPTEAAIEVSYWECDREGGKGGVPIGRPISNTRLYILDGSLQAVPIGVTGEIYIGGMPLARGYVKRADLTAERFVADPHSSKGERMYRTGDLGRWRADGAIEYVGRTDYQVKIRGYRIEMGEIEGVMMEHRLIREAVAVAREDGRGEKRLVGYVVESGDEKIEEEEVRRYMRERLPEYMVPCEIEVVERMPVTSNGKLDRRGLPEPRSRRRSRGEGREGVSSEEEEIVKRMMREVLGIEEVGLHDNFFHLGGHSLLAMRLISKIRSTLGVEFSIRTVFDAPSPAALAECLANAKKARTRLEPQPRPSEIPLSFAQRRLWFLNRLEGPSATYTIPFALRLRGSLNVSVLESALADVIERHEVLRTIFPETLGTPRQEILNYSDVPFALQVLAVDESALQTAIATAAARGFDLSSEIPLRAYIFAIDSEEHVLLLLLHHIAADGWSLAPLMRDLGHAYMARCQGTSYSLPQLPVQYADYAIWQHESLGSQTDPDSPIARQLDYWTAALADLPDELDLPMTRTRPATADYRGNLARLRWNADIHQGLIALTRKGRASLFMVLQAGLSALLSRMGAGCDIPIGSPIAGRNDSSLDDLVGCFVNTLVLRVDTSGRPSFLDLIERVRANNLSAYAHQELPFERLVEALNPTRSLARHPLFQVLLVVQNAPNPVLLIPGIEASVEPVEASVAKFDLAFQFSERHDSDGSPHGLDVLIEYRTDLFDIETVKMLAERLERLLRSAVIDSSQPIESLEIISEEEREQILIEWNNTACPVHCLTLPDLFENQAALTPSATALIFQSTRLSYEELNSRANHLALTLISRGIGPENIVALAARRSIEMVVGLLGILKSGAAYLPLDPDNPLERLSFMIDDADPSLVLTTSEIVPSLPSGIEYIELDRMEGERDVLERGRVKRIRAVKGSHAAYVIYTSGSTGKPKGVINTHEAIVNRLRWMQSVYGLKADDRVLQKTPFGFDISLWEFFSPWLAGGTLVMAEPGGHKDAAYLAELIESEQITTIHFVPSMLQAFLQHSSADKCQSLRRVICSGEALSPQLQNLFYSILNVPLHNLYGPTEAAIEVSFWDCPKGGGSSPVPIGRPIWNTSLYILDANLQPLPPGVAGELYIGGLPLARGYLNRPSLTAERFVADPHSRPGQRMYRTGDLARWRADGEIEYLGRTDYQIKIRGFRIELGEIEAAIRRYRGVSEAVVIAREDNPGERRLVGYFVGSDEEKLNVDDLRRHLCETLPEYMVPAALVLTEAMPLTNNGKLDRKALPVPEFTSAACWQAPRTPQEEILCGLFSDLLRIPSVGIHGNFFHLGGDSILSIQLVSRARQAGLKLTPRDVFRNQTVEALAAAASIADTKPLQKQDSGIGSIPLTPIMKWLLEREGPINQFSQSMLLQVPGGLSMDYLQSSLQALLDNHDILRMRLEDGNLQVPLPGAIDAAKCIRHIDITELDENTFLQLVTQEAEMAAGRLQPENGIVVQAVWFGAGSHKSGRLLLTIHHLAVDGVSWRILIPSLAEAFRAISTGQSLASQTSTSFRSWALALQKEARNPSRIEEMSWWKDELAKSDSQSDLLIFDRALDHIRDTTGTSRSIKLVLPSEKTASLMNNAARVFHATIPELLLTALAVAVIERQKANPFKNTSSQTTVLFDVENHGREDFLGDMDLSQTVGWFTSLFPVRIDLNLEIEKWESSLIQKLKSFKEHLRAVPNKGLGYGLLRYLNPETSPVLAVLSKPQIGFNYLGRFDATTGGDWAIAPEFTKMSGSSANPQMPLAHALDVNALVMDMTEGPQLYATLSWASEIITDDAVHALAELWFEVIANLIDLADKPSISGLTPSDLSLVSLSQPEIDQLEKEHHGIEDILPLSPTQEGLLFHALFDPKALDIYTVQLILRIEGPLDEEAFSAASNTLLVRHPNLRAGFAYEGLKRPVQFISTNLSDPVRIFDISNLEGEDQEKEWNLIIARDRHGHFDLGAPPLLRFTLVKFGNRNYGLLLTHHHLLLDGWSMPVLITELLTLTAKGEQAGIPPTTPYRNYLSWLDAQDRAAARIAWEQELRELNEPTRLTSSIASPIAPIPTEPVWINLSLAVTKSITKAARARGLTVNTLVQGAWAILLSRLTGLDDVVFGITVAGRSPDIRGVETMVGIFINTVPVRVRVHRACPVIEMLKRLQDRQSEMTAHHHLGLAEIQRIAQTGELFDTLLAFENFPVDRAAIEQVIPGLHIRSVEGHDATHYPLTISAFPGSRMELRLQYRNDLFKRHAVQSIGERLARMLEAIAIDLDQAIGQLDTLSQHERQQILDEWNDTSHINQFTNFVDMFEDQVERSPEALALVCGNTQINYRQLDERANALARIMIDRGLGHESIVAIALPRSIEMIIDVMGILKSGAAYLPLDPDYPLERLAFMLNDSQPALVITNTEVRDRLPDGFDYFLYDHTELPASKAERRHQIRPDHPAYIIYTSGSTGTPKGVVVTHCGLPNLAAIQVERFVVTPNSRVLQLSSPSFDASVMMMLMAFAAGAALVIPESNMLAGDLLADTLIKDAITHTLIPPALLATIPKEAIATVPLQTLVVGGEACSADLVALWSEDQRMINAYGPTEITVFATLSDPLSGNDTPPIGKPIWNTQVYVLDAALQPVPVGVPGEIYIAGIGLARGYLDMPALTAERFVANPYGKPGTRMYRTGDVAQWRTDGTLEYLGRSDRQVKIRGFRIELGEIEAALLQNSEIRHAAVVAREDTRGERRLVAYIVPSADTDVSLESVRNSLAQTLPDYMMPTAWVLLDSLPLSPNGKLDIDALPHPDFVRAKEWKGPRNPQEYALCSMFIDVLGVAPIGIYDDFFELGGHSLLAARLIGMIRSTLGTEISIRTLFESPTVATLAERLEDNTKSDPLEVLLPLRSQGGLTPLFCVHPAGGLCWCYIGLVQHLPADSPVYGLQDRIYSQRKKTHASVTEMAADYVDEIRKIQPNGPYYLIGWSFGGIVAYEMASRFHELGEEVAFLALVDSDQPPDPPPQIGMREIVASVIRDLGFDLGDRPPELATLLEFLRDEKAQRILQEHHLSVMIEAMESNFRLWCDFAPKRYKGDVLLFVATLNEEGVSEALPDKWRNYIEGDLNIHYINCPHGVLMEAGPLAEIGSVLAVELRKSAKKKGAS